MLNYAERQNWLWAHQENTAGGGASSSLLTVLLFLSWGKINGSVFIQNQKEPLRELKSMPLNQTWDLGFCLSSSISAEAQGRKGLSQTCLLRAISSNKIDLYEIHDKSTKPGRNLYQKSTLPSWLKGTEKVQHGKDSGEVCKIPATMRQLFNSTRVLFHKEEWKHRDHSQEPTGWTESDYFHFLSGECVFMSWGPSQKLLAASGIPLGLWSYMLLSFNWGCVGSSSHACIITERAGHVGGGQGLYFHWQ